MKETITIAFEGSVHVGTLTRFLLGQQGNLVLKI